MLQGVQPAGPDSFDTCDFKSFVTRGDMKYFITFIDHSHFYHVYLLNSKDETFSKFVKFRTLVEKKLGHPVKKLRSDRGGEYRSKEAEAYLKEYGRHDYSLHSIVQWNCKKEESHSMRW